MESIDRNDTLGPPVSTRPRGRGLLALTIVALLVVASLAVVVGLDTSGGESDEPNLIARSVDAAQAAGSARIAMTISLDAPGDIPAELQQPIHAEGVMLLDEPVGQISMEIDGVSMEMRILGPVFYMRIPELAEETGLDVEWLSLDLEELTGASVEELFGFDASSTNPANQLDYLRGTGEVVEIGREDVRDVPTTHYQATIDLRDALADAPESAREFLESSVEQYERETGTTEMISDVWVDDDELPRRMAFSMPVPAEEGVPAGASMAISMEFYDFGVEVNVEAPPEDQVFDMTALARHGLQ